MTNSVSGGRSATSPSTALTAAAIVWGIALIVLGILAFIYVFATSVASVLVLGVLLGLGGIAEIISAFRAGEGRLLRLLSGVLSLVVGGLLLFRPVPGVAAVGFLLAAFFFASGLFRGIVALLDRPRLWGWDLAYGIIAVLLGVVLVAGWPVSSFVVLGTLVAVELISRGIAIIGTAMAFRSAVREAHA